MPREGILFILVGPSGAGKNTLMKLVQKQLGDLPQLATATTRARRDDEQEGREHLFVTREKFQHLIETNALIEYQPVHMGDLYGTPRQTVENAITNNRDLIADIECLGASKIHDAYPGNTVLIFVTPSRLETLAERIQQRSDITPAELENRLARARFEMTFAPTCHYIILNDIVEPAAEHLRQIIISERTRRRGSPPTGQAPILTPPAFHSAAIALLQHENQVLVRKNGTAHQFPTFPITNQTALPHEVLQHAFGQMLGSEVTIEAVADERFDFVAPHHVTIATLPHDAYLYFYFKCPSPVAASAVGADWEWQPVSALHLPKSIKKLVMP